MFRHNLPIVFFLLTTMVFASERTRGDIILVVNEDILWNRDQQPEPERFIFSVSSDAAITDANIMNAFSVGIRLVRGSGSQGTVTIGEVRIPSDNRIFTSYSSVPVLAQEDESLWTISADNASFSNVEIPATGRHLFELQLYSPANDASGEFLIYADRATTNYFTTNEFDGLKFGNIPFDDQQPPDTGVLLGRLHVTAVPEPGIAWLLLSSCEWLFYRRRQARPLFRRETLCCATTMNAGMGSQ